MPTYDYVCLNCKKQAEKAKGYELAVDEMWEVTFETFHCFNPTKKELAEATTCPRCKKNDDVERQLACGSAQCYIRGNGFLDKSGTSRDMNLHKLTTTDDETGESNDPYHEMREPGEVDDLKAKLKKAGQHNPNPKTLVLSDIGDKPKKK